MFSIKRYLEKLSINKRKMCLNIFWASFGKVINMLGTLFVGILVARYLGPSEYGLMNYVISYVSIFSIISEFGLNNIEIRELSKSPQNKNVILGTCFRLRFFFSVIAYLIILVLTLVFSSDKKTTIYILIYATCIFSLPFNIILNYFTSIVQNEYIVKSQIIRTVIGGIFKIVLLWFKAPLIFFIISIVIDFYIVSSGYIYAYRKKVGNIKEWKFDSSKIRFFINQSFPLLLSGAAVILYQKIDQVMIGNMIDNTSLGYYATAARFINIVLFVPLVITQTVTPLLIREKETNYDNYLVKRQQFINVVVWLSIVISVFVSLISHYLIYYTYGSKYLLAVPVLSVLAFKTVGMALSVSSGQIIIIEKIQKWAVIKNIIGCLVCLTLNYLYLPKYGIVGSAFISVITLLTSSLVANVFIPAYYFILKIELKALFGGWKDLLKIKSLILRK